MFDMTKLNFLLVQHDVIRDFKSCHCLQKQNVARVFCCLIPGPKHTLCGVTFTRLQILNFARTFFLGRMVLNFFTQLNFENLLFQGILYEHIFRNVANTLFNCNNTRITINPFFFDHFFFR